MWQVAQVLPLVPRLWKKGLFSWIGPPVLYVATKPVGSRNGNRLGITIAEATVASARTASTGKNRWARKLHSREIVLNRISSLQENSGRPRRGLGTGRAPRGLRESQNRRLGSMEGR